MMDVYLIPVGRDRYELYCEPAEAHSSDQVAEASRGFFRTLLERFRAVLAAVEQEGRRSGPSGASSEGGPPPNWRRRVRDRVVCWIAEKIAEQRLLWNLRRQRKVTLVYPEDLFEARAMSIVRDQLQRDARRHSLWAVLHGFGSLGSLLLVPLPGPNLIGYYFIFRLVGHFLCVRGARHGLSGVAWRSQASAPLAELRQVVALSPALRESRVHEVASRLQLEHLASFFRRTAVPTPQ
jgi:hypothetical protein